MDGQGEQIDGKKDRLMNKMTADRQDSIQTYRQMDRQRGDSILESTFTFGWKRDKQTDRQTDRASN